MRIGLPSRRFHLRFIVFCALLWVLSAFVFIDVDWTSRLVDNREARGYGLTVSCGHFIFESKEIRNCQNLQFIDSGAALKMRAGSHQKPHWFELDERLSDHGFVYNPVWPLNQLGVRRIEGHIITRFYEKLPTRPRYDGLDSYGLSADFAHRDLTLIDMGYFANGSPRSVDCKSSYVAIPIWLLAIPSAAGLLICSAKRRRGDSSAMCPNCGYDLRAIDHADRCPECGQAIPGRAVVPPVP